MGPTIQMTWCLGPEGDWLASVEGLLPGMWTRGLEQLQIAMVQTPAKAWTELPIYAREVDTYYIGKRNGDLVYLYVTVSWNVERLSEQEFMSRVFARFVARDADCEAIAAPGMDGWVAGDNWDSTVKCTYWRDVIDPPAHAVVSKQAGGWVGSVFRGKGDAVYCGPKRSTCRAAKADTWFHLIRDRDIAYENYPVCGNCFGQSFECGDGFTGIWTCTKGCNAGLVGQFPRCLKCDAAVYEPDNDGRTNFCDYCDYMLNKVD
jgi:hypothetical protein